MPFDMQELGKDPRVCDFPWSNNAKSITIVKTLKGNVPPQ